MYYLNLDSLPDLAYDADLLSALIRQYLLPDEGTGIPELTADREYEIELDCYRLQVKLSHSIVKILKKNSLDFSLRILDDIVYHGQRSSIYLSTKKLILTSAEILRTTPEKLVKRCLLDHRCDDELRLLNESGLNLQLYTGSRRTYFFEDTRHQRYAYFMVPNLPGQDLSAMDKTALDLITKLNIAIALINAVNHFHNVTGQIHCDLKPANIKVDLSQSPPIVRLIDFGSAVNMSDARRGAQLNGTLGYMIPIENLERVPLQSADIVAKFYFDKKVDSYSLAIILYELFSDIPKKYHHNVATILNKMRDSGDLSYAITSFESFLVSQSSKLTHICAIQ